MTAVTAILFDGSNADQVAEFHGVVFEPSWYGAAAGDWIARPTDAPRFCVSSAVTVIRPHIAWAGTYEVCPDEASSCTCVTAKTCPVHGDLTPPPLSAPHVHGEHCNWGVVWTWDADLGRWYRSAPIVYMGNGNNDEPVPGVGGTTR